MPILLHSGITGFPLSVGAPFAALEAAPDELLGDAAGDVHERVPKPIDDNFRNDPDEFHGPDGVPDGNKSKNP